MRERRRALEDVDYSALRWAVALPASVHEHQSCPLPVRVVDISTSGCRLWAGFRLTPGCPARLIVSGIAPLRGRVVWARDWHGALQFETALHPAILRHLVAGHPPNPGGPEWALSPA